MTDVKYQHYPDDSGVMLRDAYPEILSILAKGLVRDDADDLKAELNEVRIVSQYLQGTPDNFSFMAYAFPRLTYEQLLVIDLKDEERIDVFLEDAKISINLDEFGKIDWFYIINLPEMYQALQKFMPHPPEKQKP